MSTHSSTSPASALPLRRTDRGRRLATARTWERPTEARSALCRQRRELILEGADRGSRFSACGGCDMSVYKVVEIIGTSSESWEDAAMAAVTKARETIRQVRVAEVVEQDLDLDDGGGATFRTKLRLSFKYEDEK